MKRVMTYLLALMLCATSSMAFTAPRTCAEIQADLTAAEATAATEYQNWQDAANYLAVAQSVLAQEEASLQNLLQTWGAVQHSLNQKESEQASLRDAAYAAYQTGLGFPSGSPERIHWMDVSDDLNAQADALDDVIDNLQHEVNLAQAAYNAQLEVVQEAQDNVWLWHNAMATAFTAYTQAQQAVQQLQQEYAQAGCGGSGQAACQSEPDPVSMGLLTESQYVVLQGMHVVATK